jgi:hypothetical protein
LESSGFFGVESAGALVIERLDPWTPSAGRWLAISEIGEDSTFPYNSECSHFDISELSTMSAATIISSRRNTLPCHYLSADMVADLSESSAGLAFRALSHHMCGVDSLEMWSRYKQCLIEYFDECDIGEGGLIFGLWEIAGEFELIQGLLASYISTVVQVTSFLMDATLIYALGGLLAFASCVWVHAALLAGTV